MNSVSTAELKKNQVHIEVFDEKLYELVGLYSPFPFRLKFKFKRGSVPPVMPLEFVGCIGGCDEMLRELLDLKYLNRSTQPAPPASQQANHSQANNSFSRASSDSRQARGATNPAAGHLLSLSTPRAHRPAPAAAPDNGTTQWCATVGTKPRC